MVRSEGSGDPRIGVLLEHRRAFVRFVERRVGSPDTAEDIVQEAFGRALARVDSVRDDESVMAWFYRMLRNAVVDHHRRTQTRSAALERFARELEESPVAVREEVCRCVLDVAAGLKPDYAQALRRVDVEGTPVKAFAAEVGISASNASVRLFRARDALKRRVVAACGVCAEHGCMDCTCGR